MKKLLIILLLINVAAQVSAYLQPKMEHVSFAQNLEDEDSGKLKKENVYLPALALPGRTIGDKKIYVIYSVNPGAPPPPDHHAPPPDGQING